MDSVIGDDPNDYRSKKKAIQVEELAQAMEIAERIDRLISSPPFDKNVSLLLLRGNVSLWVSDLILGKKPADEEWDNDSVIGHEEDSSEPGEEQHTRLANCRRELQHAQGFFQRAVANGARRQGSTLSSIDIKLRELERQFDKLHATQQEEDSSILTSDHSMSDSFYGHLR